MDWWIWALIVIAVVALVVVGVGMARRAKVRRTVARREHAATLRDEARDVEVDARRKEADASRIRAEAEQARVKAQELDRSATERERAANEARGLVDDKIAEADRVDPDVSGRDAATEEAPQGSHVDRTATKEPDAVVADPPAHAVRTDGDPAR